MKTLNLYLSSNNKLEAERIVKQFKNIINNFRGIVNEFTISGNLETSNESLKNSDVFIIDVGKFCDIVSIESDLHASLFYAIHNNKKILLAYSPNHAMNNEYYFYEVKTTINRKCDIAVEGIIRTSLTCLCILKKFSKEVSNNPCSEMPLYSEKDVERKFEAKLLLETEETFNEELLLIN